MYIYSTPVAFNCKNILNSKSNININVRYFPNNSDYVTNDFLLYFMLSSNQGCFKKGKN